MKFIRGIVLFCLAVTFSICFTYSSELAFVYHDISLAFHYMIVGIIILCVYLIIIWNKKKIQERFKNR